MYYNPQSWDITVPRNPETDLVEPSTFDRLLDRARREDNSYEAAKKLCRVAFEHFDVDALPGAWWWALQLVRVREALDPRLGSSSRERGARQRALRWFDWWFEPWFQKRYWERAKMLMHRGTLIASRRQQLVRTFENTRNSLVRERVRKRLYEDALSRVEYASAAADPRARRHLKHWLLEAEKYRRSVAGLSWAAARAQVLEVIRGTQ